MNLHVPRHWRRLSTRAKTFLSILAIYLSLTGLVTFSLFISYESLKTAMFGTWPAQEAGDWEAVLAGTDVMREAATIMKWMNNGIGWAQPFSFVSYRSLVHAAESHIRGLEARVFAHAPELFDQREMSFTLTPETIRSDAEGYAHTNRKITVISANSHPVGSKHRVTGKVTVADNRVVVRELGVSHAMAANLAEIVPVAEAR